VLSSRIHTAIVGGVLAATLAIGAAALLPDAGLLAAALAIRAAALLPDAWTYASEFRDAHDAIDRIEAFQKTRGYLPETLGDIGRPDDEGGPLYYSRYAEDHYTVSFAAPTHGFFGSYVYDSKTQMWHVAD
jgi:hypothetical protein